MYVFGLQKVVVKDLRNLISTQLGGKFNMEGQRIFTCYIYFCIILI